MIPAQEQALIEANEAGAKYLEALNRQNEAGDKLMEAMEQCIAELEQDMNQREYVYECNKAIEEAKSA